MRLNAALRLGAGWILQHPSAIANMYFKGRIAIESTLRSQNNPPTALYIFEPKNINIDSILPNRIKNE
jgi:hypothetical protein